MALSEATKNVIEKVVGEALPLWLSRPALEYKRVPVMTGPDSYQLDVRPYQGIQGWIAFKREFESNPLVDQLNSAITADCPKLLKSAHVTGAGWVGVNGAFALICALCDKSGEYVASGLDHAEAVSKVVNHLSELAVTEVLRVEVISMLGTLMLPDGIDEIDFGDVVLRRITQQHIEKYASNDITDLPKYDLIGEHITTALFIEREAKLSFEQDVFQRLEAHQDSMDWHKSVQTVHDNIFDAFFLLKQGHFHIVATHYSYEPLSLPGMSSSSSTHRNPQVVGFYMLEPQEIDELKRLYDGVKSIQFDRLRQAITRLRFCEGRAQATDALVDAMVGFEAILNPMNYMELSFRVALNYAFLFPEARRREKFDELSSIQKFRNDIVHGRWKANDPKQMEGLAEVLQIAKEGLRSCIKMLIFELEIGNEKKLDANFWLDRVMARPA